MKELTQKIVKEYGAANIARIVGLKRQAVHQWERIPAEHLYKLEKLTGINRKRLRPDLAASGVWRGIK